MFEFYNIFIHQTKALGKNFIVSQLINQFKGRESFTREELFTFFRQFEPDLKETTFRWRIYDLKGKQVMRPLSSQLFTLSHKQVFIPKINPADKAHWMKLQTEFPNLEACIWNTQVVHELMLHIPGRSFTILQVEKAALEPVYQFLSGNSFYSGRVFIQPNKKELARYVFETRDAIIVEQLISKSPLQQTGVVTTLTLEKLLVDIFSEKEVLAAYQGSEFVHIVNAAFERYSIDFTTLFHYARRRGQFKKLKEFIEFQTDIPKFISHD